MKALVNVNVSRFVASVAKPYHSKINAVSLDCLPVDITLMIGNVNARGIEPFAVFIVMLEPVFHLHIVVIESVSGNVRQRCKPCVSVGGVVKLDNVLFTIILKDP